MNAGLPSLALLYDDSAYRETLQPVRPSGGEAPAGLVGRQVAGREFLDAFLSHGTWEELTAVVYNQASAVSLLHYCRQHASGRSRVRRLRFVLMDRFLPSFFPEPPARVLYTPCPPDPSFAWARYHRGPGGFGLSGVTHTLCTAGAARVLCEMVTAPYEPYDCLICTSSAVTRMVRTLTDAYADYLRERHSGSPALRLQLETIPLGVNPDKFRPATPEERSARRAALHIAEDATAILFVGRFAPHAKAHPFPMLHGIARAARETGRPVHLILSGWAANSSLMDALVDAARAFAPVIPVSIVNGMDPELRFGVWQAADVFTSLSDSIQGTFGLVILEAMASGLPVVASDWDGYRDLVLDGETGFLVPTYMVRGATEDATARLLLQAAEYDTFLAECNQTTVVDPAATAAAYARLLTDSPLRRHMGAAGRQRVLERFTWAHAVRAYEALWSSQEAERLAHAAASSARGNPPGRSSFTPPCYPAPEVCFAGYPTHLLAEESRLVTVEGAEDVLGRVLAHPLTNYAQGRRVAEEAVLRAVLAEAASPRTIADLDELLSRHGVGKGPGRATLAWMLKYDLLRWAASKEKGD
jgi:glycosyltransferase involved in cell wall biosynthesis